MSLATSLIVLGLLGAGGGPTEQVASDYARPGSESDRVVLAADPDADESDEADESATPDYKVMVGFVLHTSGARVRVGGEWLPSRPFYVEVPVGPVVALQVKASIDLASLPHYSAYPPRRVDPPFPPRERDDPEDIDPEDFDPEDSDPAPPLPHYPESPHESM